MPNQAGLQSSGFELTAHPRNANSQDGFRPICVIRPNVHSTDTHGANEVNFAILAAFGYQFAPRYRHIRDKMDTLYGFKHPSKYDKECLLKPSSKANTKLMLAEEDNIRHIFASLAKRVTSQSVIVGKLSSYARKNRTKKALWELDNLYRSRYLLNYVDSVRLRRNVQRALNRGEYTFRDFGEVIDLEQMINRWVALRRDSAKKAV